jgi:hypothetical protein
MRSSTDENAIHHFYCLNLLNALVTEIADGITPCTIETEGMVTRAQASVYSNGKITADTKMNSLAKLATGPATNSLNK